MLMDQHKSSLPPPPPRFSAVVNDQTSNCSSCKSVEDALINMCVLSAECWKEQAADNAASCTGVHQATIFVNAWSAFGCCCAWPCPEPVTGLRSGWHFKVLSRPVFCSCHTGGCDLDVCLEVLNRKKRRILF